MKKPIVKKSVAKFIKKARPFAGPVAIGAAGASAVVAMKNRKKTNQLLLHCRKTFQKQNPTSEKAGEKTRSNNR